MMETETIKKAFKSASKKKRKRPDVQSIMENQDEHAEIVKKVLEEESFEPGKHKEVIINENNNMKVRKIIKPRFKYEQIIHHLVVGQLAPIITKSLDKFVCGSVPKRGPHYGKKYMEKWIHGYKGKKFYILKMDIHHFYESISHAVLIEKLSKIIKDSRMIKLIQKILSVTKRGVPIGYYTSQWFGNFLLTAMDHWIKEDLRAEHYMRYMDDMVITGKSKKKLHRMQEKISSYLKSIGLKLNDDWQVFRFEYADKAGKIKGRALDFMGFVFHRNRICIRKSNLKRIRSKANRISKKAVTTWVDATSMISRLGWFKHADAYGYYRRWIKPKINIKLLKKKISWHGIALKLKKEDSNERMARGFRGYQTA